MDRMSSYPAPTIKILNFRGIKAVPVIFRVLRSNPLPLKRTLVGMFSTWCPSEEPLLKLPFITSESVMIIRAVVVEEGTKRLSW